MKETEEEQMKDRRETNRDRASGRKKEIKK
jgi:hypothetical protein